MMYHFVIGTKAQFIKMAPMLHVLADRGLPHRVLDLGQHGSMGREILEQFGLRPEQKSLQAAAATNARSGVQWLSRGLRELSRSRKHMFAELFAGRKGVALVHGDTASTFIGTLLARQAGLPVALVEAGLRSGSLLNPFPEEIIRRTVERLATVAFAPGEQAANNLRGSSRPRNAGLHVIDTHYNTGRDAIELVRWINGIPLTEEGPPIATVHRFETISRRSRLDQAVRYLCDAARHLGKIVFVVHPPTEHYLNRYKLIEELQRTPEIRLSPLLPYPSFLRLVCAAPLVITDGGSVQEEAAYLGKACIVMRSRTEREDGIGTTAHLTSWNAELDIERTQASSAFHLDSQPMLEASKRIIDVLDARFRMSL
jgi:UDP-N-acetylglucosamine 2-epimerase (non-hydrolysing)